MPVACRLMTCADRRKSRSSAGASITTQRPVHVVRANRATARRTVLDERKPRWLHADVVGRALWRAEPEVGGVGWPPLSTLRSCAWCVRQPSSPGAFRRSGPLGLSKLWQTLPCASWPVTAADLYTGPWHRRTSRRVDLGLRARVLTAGFYGWRTAVSSGIVTVVCPWATGRPAKDCEWTGERIQTRLRGYRSRVTFRGRWSRSPALRQALWSDWSRFPVYAGRPARL